MAFGWFVTTLVICFFMFVTSVMLIIAIHKVSRDMLREKVPYGLSRYDTDILDFFFLKSRCHTKRWMGVAGTPGGSTWEVRKCLSFCSKAGFKSLFPAVYDNPILLHVGMSYIFGKLLSPAFECSEVLRGTQTCHCVLAPGVPGWPVHHALLNITTSTPPSLPK